MINREMREYELAEKVVVLSKFAYDSFVDQGVPQDRVSLIPLGVNVEHFRSTKEELELRSRS